jgi:pimeloyl-ACP methyl ester carboxylesterase
VLRSHPHARELTQTSASGWLWFTFAQFARKFRVWATPQTATLLLALFLLMPGGCASHKYLTLRDTPANPLAIPLQLTSSSGPQISSRTKELLRRYALGEQYEKEPAKCLESLQHMLDVEVDSELVYGVSEMAYILGQRAEKKHDVALALDMYGVAVSNAYMFLFSAEFDGSRNPYDPQFRGACDLYNGSLESSLRLVNAKGQLKPGTSYEVTTGKQTYEVATILRGNWRNEDFERFEFVSEFELDKLIGTGTTYGIGVPLIAVRKAGDPEDPREKYYPKGLSFPVTAVLRVVKPGSMPGHGAMHRHHCVLELHDPLAARDLQIADRLVPMQSDLSTSLGFFLDSEQFKEKDQATYGLINPRNTQDHRGIFMLEPFDPGRIPVLMVHGLWSSPSTWMPMFNDLRSFPELRKHYQFWFYQYPTGQPFWLSATQFRADLNKLRAELDPDHRYPALDQAVLVGHSMGGLVSRMQTIDSRDQFWKILSDEPFEKVQGEPEMVAGLREAAFFGPNESIRRVVTIGTPLRGSEYANSTTRWLSRQVIKLPTIMVQSGTALITQNPGLFQNTELLTTSTSIDSLSPDSPVFPAMLQAPRAPWVTYHNIVGMTPTKRMFHEDEATGDGVVSFESAHADDAVSEVVVADRHQDIHRNPKSILEVRRILVEHLTVLRTEFRAKQLAAAQSAFGPQFPQANPNNATFESDAAAKTIETIQMIGAPKRPAPANLLNSPAPPKWLNGTSRKTPSL